MLTGASPRAARPAIQAASRQTCVDGAGTIDAVAGGGSVQRASGSAFCGSIAPSAEVIAYL